MALYKVTRYSDCGTYFQPYLQSVTVVADSKASAQSAIQKWSKQTGESFVESKYAPEWEVLSEDVTCPFDKVVDFVVDSDY